MAVKFQVYRVFKIRLSSLHAVQKYLEHATVFDGELVMQSGQWTVDGKSSLGVLSLNLTKDITLTVRAEHPIQVDSFADKIREYIKGEIKC